jgi:hypothetical protein
MPRLPVGAAGAPPVGGRASMCYISLFYTEFFDAVAGRNHSHCSGGNVNRKKTTNRNGEVDRARDELFSHIHRCGVLQATEEHQIEWLRETIEYLGERYPELSADDLRELEQIGIRFCRPVIQRVEEEAEVDQDGDERVASEAAAA